MNDIHPYLASEELAQALTAYQVHDREFTARVQQFDRDHPGHELLWASRGWSADMRPVGFRDGHSEVPPGLSRSQKRTELIPKRGGAGREWREHLAWANTQPRLDDVLALYGVPTFAHGPYRADLSHFVCPTRWANCGADGVLVINDFDLTPPAPQSLTEHLTPMRLSEFYAIKERMDAA